MSRQRLLLLFLLVLVSGGAAVVHAARHRLIAGRRAVEEALLHAKAGAEEASSVLGARGVVVGVFSDGDGDTYKSDLADIKALGADHVLIVVQHAMRDVHSTRIRPRSWLTPSAERLDAVFTEARSLGLGILLMPTLYIEETGEGQWRGAIEPTSWDAWWRSYERFILHHAELAREHDVEVFIVGSELCSTELQRVRWARLLSRVRKETPSLLSYSFNWDHLRDGQIADLFDVVGMNAYFDLDSGGDSPVSSMVDSWRDIQADVLTWRAEQGRPLLFTEVGFRSVVDASSSPWDYTKQLSYDGEAQKRCYEAFLTAWGGKPEVAGVFFYSWRGEGGVGDTTYTPKGKPAESVLRRWMNEPRQLGASFSVGTGSESNHATKTTSDCETSVP